MIKKGTFLIFTAIFVLSSFLLAQRGLKVVIKTKDGSSFKLYDQCRALVIGVSDYLYWPKLPNAVKDAREVASVLQKRGFLTSILENPTSKMLKEALNKFLLKECKPEDGVLIYFAGHGETMEQADGAKLGFIVPKDCPPFSDIIGFNESALSMGDIQEYSLKLKSKHLLAIFDSCFSGSIFSLERGAPAYITNKTAQKVRQYITAGSEDESVPDESIFKKCFINGLNGDADLNDDGYVTGQELGMYLENMVIRYTNGAQNPQYGKINNPNLDRGDFVFVLESRLEEVGKPSEQPKPETALEPRYGGLEIYIDVTGARVYLDGNYQDSSKKGYAIVIKKLLIGTHVLRISHENYKDYESAIEIKEGETIQLEPTLEPIISPTPKYLLEIHSVPENARIIINGKDLGTTPFQQEFEVGRYKIRIEKDGYKPREEEINVNSSISKRIILDKIDYGFLIVSAYPYAELIIDGNPRGEVPPLRKIKLLEGKHRIMLKKGTKEIFEEIINIKANETKKFHHIFQ